MPTGWTVQSQHQEDIIREKIAVTKQELLDAGVETIPARHEHRI